MRLLSTATASMRGGLRQLDELLGVGPIWDLRDPHRVQLPVLPTGFLGVDGLLGSGGIPRGRMTLLAGSRSLGKTTLALQIADHLLSKSHSVGYLDPALDPTLDGLHDSRALAHLDDLVVVRPHNVEDFFSVALRLLKVRGFDLIVMDNLQAIGALETTNDRGGAAGGLAMAVRTGFRDQWLKLRHQLVRTETALLIVARPNRRPGVYDRVQALSSVRIMLQPDGEEGPGRKKGDRHQHTVSLRVDAPSAPASGFSGRIELKSENRGLFDIDDHLRDAARRCGALRFEDGGWLLNGKPWRPRRKTAPSPGSDTCSHHRQLTEAVLNRIAAHPEIKRHYLGDSEGPAVNGGASRENPIAHTDREASSHPHEKIRDGSEPKQAKEDTHEKEHPVRIPIG